MQLSLALAGGGVLHEVNDPLCSLKTGLDKIARGGLALGVTAIG